MTKKDALRSVPRLFAAGEQFDTRSVRSVFSDVHAAVENDQNYFLPAGKKLCEAFFDSLTHPQSLGLRVFICFNSLSVSFFSLQIFHKTLDLNTVKRENIIFMNGFSA